MKLKILLLSIVLIFPCCKKILFDDDPENTPQSNFKIFWTDFQDYYPAFVLNNINWDSVYIVNSTKINDHTSYQDLFNIMKSSILTLKDAHSDIISRQYGSIDYNKIFLTRKPKNFISAELIFSKYVTLLNTNKKRDIAYGQILNENIGYFFIGSFSEDKNDYNAIDPFIEKFKNAKGLIFDVRQNGGGNSTNGKTLASRLTNESRTYEYVRFRNGPKYNDLSDYYEGILNPAGNLRFTKRIVLLTNRYTASAAENFTLMVRSLPYAIHIGDTTFGLAATNPIIKPLPNGWSYRMSRTLLCDTDKKPIKKGIAPALEVPITRTDSLQKIDRILEKAIEIINEGSK